MLDNQFDHKHYRFPREHTGAAPRRSAPPLTGWGIYLLRVATFALAAIATAMLAKAVL